MKITGNKNYSKIGDGGCREWESKENSRIGKRSYL